MLEHFERRKIDFRGFNDLAGKQECKVECQTGNKYG